MATASEAFRPANSRRLHELAPGLVLWECDKTVYRAGWLRDGIVCPAQLGTRGSWLTCYPDRPDYFTHWGGAFEYAASVLGLPVGDYPHSRPPQAVLPAAAREQITAAYRRLGLIAS